MWSKMREARCGMKRLDFGNMENTASEDLNITSPLPLLTLKKTSPIMQTYSMCKSPITSPRCPKPLAKSHKRSRSVRLFASPTTPRTLFQVSEKSKSVTKPQKLRPHERLSTSPHINPFTPSGMYLSRRSKHNSVNSSPEQERIPLIKENPELADVSMEEIEETLTQSRKLKFCEIHSDRYNKEFIEFEQIGKGDFGGVYLCKHKLDGCLYAIKKSEIPKHGSFNERVALNEVYAHAVLGKHPHVVRYHSAWAETDCMMVQSEFCNGGSLSKLLHDNRKQNKKFTDEELKQILIHTAKALSYIHSQKLVHLDVKPDNILICKESPDDTTRTDKIETIYKIGDLGLVTSLVDPKVEEGDNRYLATEILADDHSNLTKADIFSLGMTMFEAAHGEPLPGNGETWRSYREGNLPLVEGVSDDLMNLIKSMCDNDPTKRPSAAEILDRVCDLENTQESLQQQVERLQLSERRLSSNLEQAAAYLESINPSFAASLRDAIASPPTAKLFEHGHYTPPKESPLAPKVTSRSRARILRRTSPIDFKRKLNK